MSAVVGVGVRFKLTSASMNGLSAHRLRSISVPLSAASERVRTEADIMPQRQLHKQVTMWSVHQLVVHKLADVWLLLAALERVRAGANIKPKRQQYKHLSCLVQNFAMNKLAVHKLAGHHLADICIDVQLSAALQGVRAGAHVLPPRQLHKQHTCICVPSVTEVYKLADTQPVVQLSAALERVRAGADIMPQRQLHKQLTDQLGPEWRSKLTNFEDEPLAAASIGQVCL